jgi:hypothetical protein
MWFWGQVYSIVQWFVIDPIPWQHLDQFEKKSSTKVATSEIFLFLNMRK